jgi:hypothetical protein
VVIGEADAFVGDAVDGRRVVAHHAAVVVADDPGANVIAPNDENVGFLVRRLNWSEGAEKRHASRQQSAVTSRSAIALVLVSCLFPVGASGSSALNTYFVVLLAINSSTEMRQIFVSKGMASSVVLRSGPYAAAWSESTVPARTHFASRHKSSASQQMTT